MSEQPSVNAYPTTRQSFGVLGIMLLISLLCAPMSLLKHILHSDLVNLLLMIAVDGLTIYSVLQVRRRKLKEPFVLQQKIPGGYLLLLIVLAAVSLSIGIVDPLAGLIPMPDAFKDFMMDAIGGRNIYSFLSVVIAAPLFEEFLFRGILLDGLLKNYSPRKAIIISALLFGIVHLNPWQFIGAFFCGILMGWIYYRTKNIWYTVFYHFANNLLGFVFTTDKDSFNQSFAGIIHCVQYQWLIVATAIGLLALVLWLLHRRFNTLHPIGIPVE